MHVNTLLVQQVLAEPAWAKMLSDEDRRGMTALFWSNVTPYGTFRLDMDARSTLNRLPPCPALAHLPAPPTDHARRRDEGLPGFIDRAPDPRAGLAMV